MFSVESELHQLHARKMELISAAITEEPLNIVCRRVANGNRNRDRKMHPTRRYSCPEHVLLPRNSSAIKLIDEEIKILEDRLDNANDDSIPSSCPTE